MYSMLLITSVSHAEQTKKNKTSQKISFVLTVNLNHLMHPTVTNRCVTKLGSIFPQNFQPISALNFIFLVQLFSWLLLVFKNRENCPMC